MINIDIKSFALGVSSNPEPTGTKNITENGIHNVKDYEFADVSVEAPAPELVDITITQNGTYNHPNKDGYDEVTVDVPNTYTQSDEGKVVSSGALVSQTSTTKNANGTYDTTLNNSVTVAVPQPTGNINITDMNQTNVADYATAQVVDADLVAGNIKKDVNILGVTGTYEGSSSVETGCTVTTDATNKIMTYDIYGYSLSNASSNLKIPPVSMHYWDQKTGTSSGWNIYVNLHSSEIEDIPDSWMYSSTNTNWRIPHLTIPSTVENIRASAFQNCAFLEITLPNILQYISANVFRGCKYLTSITIPSPVYYVGANCFDGCSALQTVTFNGTPTTIGSNAFRNCTALTDIYVPWSEGAVSGAPWGAPNATIHYDWSA